MNNEDKGTVDFFRGVFLFDSFKAKNIHPIWVDS
jgi:hypothetical protein